jgi:hypothetical protein
MAYLNLSNQYCANRAAALSYLWQYIEAMGWVLHDNQDASSYRVYKSNHEDGDRLYQYIKIQWTNVNTIGLIGYYYWNATTHTGVGAASSGAAITVTTAEAGFYLWVWGNKNLVIIMTKVSTTYYTYGFGHLPKRYWTTPETVLTQNATSGSDVTITVSDTTGFKAGNYYQIIGAGGEGRDKVMVLSITDGTHMVIDSLPRNYNTGAVIWICPLAFGIISTALSYHSLTCPLNAVGTNNSNVNVPGRGIIDTTKTIPDYRAQQYIFGGIVFQDGTTSSANIVGYVDDYFLDIGPAGQSNEDTFGVNEMDGGTSSGSNGVDTLNDTSKNWGVNAHVGKVCIITGGLSGAVGQIAKIVSNTATQLVVSCETSNGHWSVIPDTTSAYKICDEGWRFINTSTGRVCREAV